MLLSYQLYSVPLVQNALLLANNVDTGEYRIVVTLDIEQPTQFEPQFAPQIAGLAVGTSRNQALVLDRKTGLIGVDLATGTQALISDNIKFTQRSLNIGAWDTRASLVYDTIFDRAFTVTHIFENSVQA